MAILIKNSIEEWVSNIKMNFETFVLFNFFILLFFSFFGTGMPFRERSAESLEAESTNITNQIIYGYLLVSSLLIIIQNPRITFGLIQKEKYLTIFIILCLISSVWSDHSLLSIKRSSQLAGSFFTIINVLILAPHYRTITVIKFISVLYLVLTYISGIMVPEAIDPAFGTWRGMELQKNGLGQIGVLLFSLSLLAHNINSSKNEILLNYVISFLAAGIVILSGSSTNTIALLLVLSILLIFAIEKVLSPFGMGKTTTLIIIFFLALSVGLISLFSEELIAIIPGLFGKDMSLTGRDIMWPFLVSEVEKKLWFGYGYGTYWILGTGLIETFMEHVGWKVNTAHNGYLEILLQLGLIGGVFFLILLFIFIYRLLKIYHKPALIALLVILVINLTESLIFQYRGPVTIVFMYFYLLVSQSFFFPVTGGTENSKFKSGFNNLRNINSKNQN